MNQTVNPSPPSQLPHPSVGEFLGPRWFLGFFRAFAGSWFLSRQYLYFFQGVPALLVLAVGAVVMWRMAARPGDQLAAAYERAAVRAGKLENSEEADLMWGRLMQLRPDDRRYQFTLAMSLVDQDRLPEARNHLDVLIGEKAYTPARMWLVDQARDESPVFPMTPEQQTAQLRAAVHEDPGNGEAHRLLAQLFVEQKDYRVAEQHLLQAVDQHPVLGLPLYELQKQLGRQDQQQLEARLRRAARALEEQVLKVPDHVQTRIFWAQALVHLGQPEEAEAVLTESRERLKSPKLDRAAAEFLIGRARQLLLRSPQNAPVAARMSLKAASIMPDHALLGPMIVTLAARGVKFSQADLEPIQAALTTQMQSEENSLNARLVLAQITAVLGDTDQAVALLEPHQQDNAAVQSLLVRMYRQSGLQEKSEQLADELVAGLQQVSSENPKDPLAALRLVEGLLVAVRLAETREAVEQFAAAQGIETSELPPAFRQKYVASCLVEYGQLDDKLSTAAVDLLERAVSVGTYSTELVQVIALLSANEGPAGERGREMLNTMLASGGGNSQIYSALGTYALANSEFGQAVEQLRRALALSPGSPVILNNLALALIRQSADNFAQAMDLCDQALRLMPGHPDVLSTRAEILISQERWNDARTDLEAVLPHRSRSRLVRELLVKVYTAVDEPSLAATHRLFLQQQAEETGNPKPETP